MLHWLGSCIAEEDWFGKGGERKREKAAGLVDLCYATYKYIPRRLEVGDMI